MPTHVATFTATACHANCLNITSTSLIDYEELYCCFFGDDGHVPSADRGLAVAAAVLWIVFLFKIIASTADDYVVPTLTSFAKALRLTPNLAGVTLLAFGNGAPDLFTSLSSFTTGTGAIGVGAVLGAGTFITTVVLGSVVLIAPFVAERRPLVRDLAFYLAGVTILGHMCLRGAIDSAEALALPLLYAVYVLVVVGGHVVQTMRKREHFEGDRQPMALSLLPDVHALPDGAARGTLASELEKQLEAGISHELGTPPLIATEQAAAGDATSGTGATAAAAAATAAAADATATATATVAAAAAANVWQRYVPTPKGIRRPKGGHSRQASLGSDAKVFQRIEAQYDQVTHTSRGAAVVAVPKPRATCMLSSGPPSTSGFSFMDGYSDCDRESAVLNSARLSLLNSSGTASSRTRDSALLNSAHLSLPNSTGTASSRNAGGSSGSSCQPLTPASMPQLLPQPRSSCILPTVSSESASDTGSSPKTGDSVSSSPSESLTIASLVHRLDYSSSLPPHRTSCMLPTVSSEMTLDAGLEPRRLSDGGAADTVDIRVANADANETTGSRHVPTQSLNDPRIAPRSVAADAPPIRCCQTLRAHFVREYARCLECSEWESKSIFSKLFFPFEMLFTAARLLTIPMLESKCWSPGLCAASFPNAALFLLFASGHAAARVNTASGGVYVPVWVIVLILSLPFAMLLYAALSSREPPQAMLLRIPLLLVGFITSCTWTYLIAAELVNALDTLGAVLGVSRTILGLTVMAWGNSLGDLVADTALARSGNPRIGAAACFGGPIFNLLVGNGITMCIVASRNHGRFCIEYDSIIPLSLAFLVGSILLNSGSIMFQRWHLTRLHGGALISYYICFLFWAIAIAMRGWAHYDDFFKSLIIPECRR